MAKSKKIINGLDNKTHQIGTIVDPYLLKESDPFVPVVSKKSIKVLTKNRLWHILLSVMKRKDDKPMTTKVKTQTNYMRLGAIGLLAVAAIPGITELTGGRIQDVIVASLLVAILFSIAIDYRK